MTVWHRLDIPSWDVYQPVLHDCAVDVWKAGQSTAQLSVLTLRPIAILCWTILELIWEVAQVLFRILLSQGWIQLKKGMIQLKAAAIWFYHFQMSLSRMEILGEVALVGIAIGLYYLYKWIRRQTYWQRFMKWYADKKQRAIEVRLPVALPYYYSYIFLPVSSSSRAVSQEGSSGSVRFSVLGAEVGVWCFVVFLNRVEGVVVIDGPRADLASIMCHVLF
jgi:hypothetical protein